jgi:sulfhydrogenase subunit beta (sulfur reductase)
MQAELLQHNEQGAHAGVPQRAKLLQRDKLPQLLEAMLQDYEVIAPRDQFSYGRIESAGEFHLSKHHPARSLKEFFFPEREVLFQYRPGTCELDQVALKPSAETTRIIFGAFPCDAAALPILDKLFGWDYVDTSYMQRRQQTAIFTIACDEPEKTCFCTAVGISPVDIEGSDVLLSPLGDVYHVEIVTPRGAALVERYGEFFTDSDPQHDDARARLEDELRGRISRHIDINGLRQGLTFDSPAWDKLVEQCVDCAVCTFVCPTCHCFDIQDEGTRSGGSRVRLWDSCAREDFTAMAAHQPRPVHYRRYRQRLMHKFQYYPQNFGRVLCVGCGRCIQHCPVGIDITEALEKAVK